MRCLAVQTGRRAWRGAVADRCPRLACWRRLSMLFPERAVTDLTTVSLNFCSGRLGLWTDFFSKGHRIGSRHSRTCPSGHCEGPSEVRPARQSGSVSSGARAPGHSPGPRSLRGRPDRDAMWPLSVSTVTPVYLFAANFTRKPVIFLG